MREYLLKVASTAKAEATKLLALRDPPTHVRLSVLAELSNYGYPPATEGELLAVGQHGVVLGLENLDVPHDFVPWTNIVFVTDGTALSKELKAKAKK